MVQLIVGSKGKGKTKQLLDRAAEAIKTASGSVVYVDKSAQHMYELSNKIRLINISSFPVNSEDGYIGSVSYTHLDVYKRQLKYKASGVIVVHNHPSGDPEPSSDDMLLS